MAKDLIAIGEVIKPHGIKGELSIESYADSPGLFGQLPRVFLDRGTGPPLKYGIKSFRVHKGRVLLFLAGVDSRTSAEELRGARVLARKSDLPPAEPGEIYLFDLIGYQVFLENGDKLGNIAGVMTHAGQEVWAIRTPAGDEVLFPVTEQFVSRLDDEARAVHISPPPGLLDVCVTKKGE